MPHTHSAKKRLRQTLKRRASNRATKKTLKTHIKRVEDVAPTASPEQLQKEFIAAVKKLDKAAAKRVIHPNLAARKKSQLAKMVRLKTAEKA